MPAQYGMTLKKNMWTRGFDSIAVKRERWCCVTKPYAQNYGILRYDSAILYLSANTWRYIPEDTERET